MFLYKILLTQILFLLCIPLGHGYTIYNATNSTVPPPVEKVKPPKKKKKYRSRHNKKRHLNKTKQKQKQLFTIKDSPADYTIIYVFVISYTALLVTSALLVLFGIFAAPVLIVGICLLGVLDILALIFWAQDREIPSAFGEGLILLLFNLLAGLSCLIYGLIIFLPFLWILGIILLSLAFLMCVFAIIEFVRRKKKYKFSSLTEKKCK